MEYPFLTENKQIQNYNPERSYTFVCIVYFVALTSLAALSSTPAAKSLFSWLLPAFYEFSKYLAG